MNEVKLWWGIAGMTPSGTGSYYYWSNFFIIVDNIAYDKVVGLWGREVNSTAWKFYPANFKSSLGQNKELWTVNPLWSSEIVEFAVKYTVAGTTYWDNNDWYNYRLDNQAAHMEDGVGTAVIGTAVLSQCGDNAVYNNKLCVGISVQNRYFNKHVGIRYTTNNWASFTDVSARYITSFAPHGLQHQPVVECWVTPEITLPTGWSTLEYATFFDNEWDNNFGKNYHSHAAVTRVVKEKIEKTTTVQAMPDMLFWTHKAMLKDTRETERNTVNKMQFAK